MSRAAPEPSTANVSPEATAAELARARAQLQESLAALQGRIDEMRDWRTWVRRNPRKFLGAAFGLGFLLGLRGWRTELP